MSFYAEFKKLTSIEASNMPILMIAFNLLDIRTGEPESEEGGV